MHLKFDLALIGLTPETRPITGETKDKLDAEVYLMRVLGTFVIRCCHVIRGLISDGEYSLDIHCYIQFSRHDAGGMISTKPEGRSFHPRERLRRCTS